MRKKFIQSSLSDSVEILRQVVGIIFFYPEKRDKFVVRSDLISDRFVYKKSFLSVNFFSRFFFACARAPLKG